MVNKTDQTRLKKSLLTAVRRRLHRDMINKTQRPPVELDRPITMLNELEGDLSRHAQERHVA